MNTQKVEALKIFLTAFFFTYENQLPLCDFNSNAPTHRERYVVCHQIINYFCLLETSNIFKNCFGDFLSSNDNPLSLHSLGAFIFYSEDPSRHISNCTTDSWSIRRQWEKELKESYCQRKASAEKTWQSYLCAKQEPNMPSIDKQNFGYWKEHLLPLIYNYKEVYSSTVQTEIKAELLKRCSSKRTF